jgi:hypothetical protein
MVQLPEEAKQQGSSDNSSLPTRFTSWAEESTSILQRDGTVMERMHATLCRTCHLACSAVLTWARDGLEGVIPRRLVRDRAYGARIAYLRQAMLVALGLDEFV